MVDDGGDAGEQILPGTGQQRIPARNRMAFGDQRGMAVLYVLRPVVGAAIWWHAKPAVMVAMEMVVGVNQSRSDVASRESEVDVEATGCLDYSIALDRDYAIRRADQGA